MTSFTAGKPNCWHTTFPTLISQFLSAQTGNQFVLLRISTQPYPAISPRIRTGNVSKRKLKEYIWDFDGEVSCQNKRLSPLKSWVELILTMDCTLVKTHVKRASQHSAGSTLCRQSWPVIFSGYSHRESRQGGLG